MKPMGYPGGLGELTVETEDTLRLARLPEDLTQEQLKVELFDGTLLRITAENTDYEWFMDDYDQGSQLTCSMPIADALAKQSTSIIESVKRVGVDSGGAIWELKLANPKVFSAEYSM